MSPSSFEAVKRGKPTLKAHEPHPYFSCNIATEDFANLKAEDADAPRRIVSSRFASSQMDLDNMRAQGVRAVKASCYCGRRTVVDVSALPGSIEVPSLRSRLRCGPRRSAP